MSLQIKSFILPVHTDTSIENEINNFLKSHKVIKMRKEFLNNSENACWCLLVEYVLDEKENSKQSKGFKNIIDYKEVLSPDDFSVYAKIREWRKETADKNGVQLYTILNNEQMARIAQEKITKLDKLKEMSGIGEQRIKKYGKDIIDLMKKIINTNDLSGNQTKNEKSQ